MGKSRTTMKKYPVYLCLAVLALLNACEPSHRLDDFLRPAPVEPLAEVMRTATPLGYFAMVAMADQMGYSIPYEKISLAEGFSLIRIVPGKEFPLAYQDESCREVLVLAFAADEDFSILSIFYICEGKSGGEVERILELHTMPVLEEGGRVKAVFASQDIHVRDSVELSLHMGPGNIAIDLERVEAPNPENELAAIKQNAWIIEVNPAGTWENFLDDSYTLIGGEQDVSVLTGEKYSNTSVIQLAMIETVLRPECILAPVEGHALLREVGVETAGEESMDDLVIGTVFYHFTDDCTGEVTIPLATGNFISSTGKKVDLELLE